MATETVCWNCWATDHDRLGCRNPWLTVSDREQLRLELGAPLPDDPQYSALLKILCFNCWESNDHYHMKCPKPRKTNEEREKLRVDMGVSLSPLWIRFIRLRAPHIRPLYDGEKLDVTRARNDFSAPYFNPTTTKAGQPQLGDRLPRSTDYVTRETNHGQFSGRGVQGPPGPREMHPINPQATPFVPPSWMPVCQQRSINKSRQENRTAFATPKSNFDKALPPLAHTQSKKHDSLPSAKLAGSKALTSLDTKIQQVNISENSCVVADHPTISSVHREVVEMRAELAEFSADAKRTLGEISASISQLKEAMGLLIWEKKTKPATGDHRRENEAEQADQEKAGKDDVEHELKDTKDESLESIERRYLPMSLNGMQQA